MQDAACFCCTAVDGLTASKFKSKVFKYTQATICHLAGIEETRSEQRQLLGVLDVHCAWRESHGSRSSGSFARYHRGRQL